LAQRDRLAIVAGAHGIPTGIARLHAPLLVNERD